MMPLRPRFVFESSDITLSLPARPWEPGLRAVGAGVMTSGAGVPSSWVTRWEYPFGMRLRFSENEWPAVRDMVQAGMSGGTITVYPESDVLIGYPCYLVEPEMGDEVFPARGESGELELQVMFRRTSGEPIDREYFYE